MPTIHVSKNALNILDRKKSELKKDTGIESLSYSMIVESFNKNQGELKR